MEHTPGLRLGNIEGRDPVGERGGKPGAPPHQQGEQEVERHCVGAAALPRVFH